MQRNKHIGLYKRGNIWWCKYYVNGKPIRESTLTTKVTEAQRFLNERKGRAATGQPMLQRMDKILYDEIAEDLWRHYETTGTRDLKEAKVRLRPLASFFNGKRVVEISGAEVTKYVKLRQIAGVTNGTINRERSTLVTMLRIAYENGKLARLPVLHRLKEAPPRQGFFERDQYNAVCRFLPPDLQLAITIAYECGWRTQSEILPLKLSQVNLDAGTLRLEPGQTKNGEGRVAYVTPRLKQMIEKQMERVKCLSRQLHRIVPYLFPHLQGRHIGNQRRDFRKAWTTACNKAGLIGMLRHDFRRTAVRNMVNAAVPERVAMAITGHKTRAVFDRYHIVSPADLQEAARKVAGHNLGTIPESALTPSR